MASLCLRHHFAPGGAYIAFSVTGVTSMLSKGKGVGMRVSGCLNAGVGMLVVVVNCPSQGAALPYPLPAIGFILGCMPSGGSRGPRVIAGFLTKLFDSRRHGCGLMASNVFFTSRSVVSLWRRDREGLKPGTMLPGT